MPSNIDIPNDEPTIREMFQRHWQAIRTRQSRRNRLQDWYNFRLESYDRHVFQHYLNQILNDQSTVFRLNMSFGFVLRNTETGALQYYHASSNNHRVFDQPFLINSPQDLQQVLDAIHNLDILEWVRQQRPNSKWVVDVVTNVCFYVNKLRNYPIGRSTFLPPYIIHNKAILALECDKNNGQQYSDNLCFFRCLALRRGYNLKNLERETKSCFER